MCVYIKRAIAHRRGSSFIQRDKTNQCSMHLISRKPDSQAWQTQSKHQNQKLPVCRSASAPMSVMLDMFLVPMHVYKVFFVCKLRVGPCSFLSSFKMYFSALGVFFFLCLFRVQVQGHLVFFWRKHARQVELDVLIHKKGHTGRWQDPNEVGS